MLRCETKLFYALDYVEQVISETLANEEYKGDKANLCELGIKVVQTQKELLKYYKKATQQALCLVKEIQEDNE